MKNKAPLALMEQLVMVLVFALAAALCLQVFICADQMSRRNQMYDRAVLAAQSAAETIKYVRGDQQLAAQTMGGSWDGDTWQLWYNEDGTMVENRELADFWLCVTETDSGQPMLATAEVTARTNDEPLFEFTVAWQEVDVHEKS